MSSSSGLTYARRMARLSARIFGQVVRKTTPQDYKVVNMFARKPWQKELVRWYPPLASYSTILLRLRHLGLYHDEHLDFKELMDEQRKKRGKGKAKKGQGKRSKKKR